MANTLVLTVGLPYSGKSSWAETVGHPVVCPDSIRLALHGQRFEPRSEPRSEPFVWAIARTMVRSLFLSGHITVILDACNITAERRAEWDDPDWTVFHQHFNATAQECIARAQIAGDLDIIPVILRMAKEQET